MAQSVDINRVLPCEAHVHAPRHAPYGDDPQHEEHLIQQAAAIIGRQIVTGAAAYEKLTTDFDTIHVWRAAVLMPDEVSSAMDALLAAERRGHEKAVARLQNAAEEAAGDLAIALKKIAADLRSV